MDEVRGLKGWKGWKVEGKEDGREDEDVYLEGLVGASGSLGEKKNSNGQARQNIEAENFLLVLSCPKRPLEAKSMPVISNHCRQRPNRTVEQ